VHPFSLAFQDRSLGVTMVEPLSKRVQRTRVACAINMTRSIVEAGTCGIVPSALVFDHRVTCRSDGNRSPAFNVIRRLVDKQNWVKLRDL